MERKNYLVACEDIAFAACNEDSGYPGLVSRQKAFTIEKGSRFLVETDDHDCKIIFYSHARQISFADMGKLMLSQKAVIVKLYWDRKRDLHCPKFHAGWNWQGH